MTPHCSMILPMFLAWHEYQPQNVQSSCVICFEHVLSSSVTYTKKNQRAAKQSIIQKNSEQIVLFFPRLFIRVVIPWNLLYPCWICGTQVVSIPNSYIIVVANNVFLFSALPINAFVFNARFCDISFNGRTIFGVVVFILGVSDLKRLFQRLYIYFNVYFVHIDLPQNNLHPRHWFLRMKPTCGLLVAFQQIQGCKPVGCGQNHPTYTNVIDILGFEKMQWTVQSKVAKNYCIHDMTVGTIETYVTQSNLFAWLLGVKCCLLPQCSAAET